MCNVLCISDLFSGAGTPLCLRFSLPNQSGGKQRTALYLSLSGSPVSDCPCIWAIGGGQFGEQDSYQDDEEDKVDLQRHKTSAQSGTV